MSTPSLDPKHRGSRDPLDSSASSRSTGLSSAHQHSSSSHSASATNAGYNSVSTSQFHHQPYPTSGSSRESISTQISGVMPPFLFNTTHAAPTSNTRFGSQHGSSSSASASATHVNPPLHIATQYPQRSSYTHPSSSSVASSNPNQPSAASRALPSTPNYRPSPHQSPPHSHSHTHSHPQASSSANATLHSTPSNSKMNPAPFAPPSPLSKQPRPTSTASSYRRSVLHPPPPTPVPDAKLVYTTPQGGRTFFMLNRDITTIGRKEDNHIVLSCAKISKHHALIERSEFAYLLRDRNSSNGVKLNDVYVSQVTPLNDGDRIHIGTVTLHFQFIQPDQQDTLEKDHLKLVTILPSERKYEDTVSIRAELDDMSTTDFPSVHQIFDMETLKEDYEKLRLAYELSKLSYTSDINDHLTKMLDLMFSVLPVDRGVVLLVDKATSLLVTNMVKLREGKGYEGREILLSSTILQRVYNTRKCLITSDACEDPDLGKSQSIARGQIRSVICVPILAHEDVLGILHLDSRDRINAFLEKDLSLVQTIINQTALQIENSFLFAQLQTEIRVTEQLQRFLPPQVVHRMVKKEEVIRKGGCEMNGTIIFADIRGFTNLSEKSSPSEVFDLLNDYFERLVQIVFKYNGVVDKFIGDELMAVFGTLDDPTVDLTPSVLNSVHAALEFKTAVSVMNEEREKLGKLPIAIGVGLNTGRLMSGFMGSSQRLEYTCIGDTVNLASRICGYASADQVLISEETAKYIKGRIDVRFVGARQFKGKEKETRVYEAIGITEDGLMENASEVSGPASSVGAANY